MSVLVVEQNVATSGQQEILSGMYLHSYIDQSSFEQIAGVCSNKDDPKMRSLTIRSFIIGLVFVLGMSFYHMWYYVTNLYAEITPQIVILVSFIIGKILAMIGDGPLTIKEHTIVLVMGNIAWTFAEMYDFSAISFIQYQERRESFKFVYMFFFVVAIQFLGFGLAGILRRFLVWPSGQIWPSNFPSIAFMRTLHENQTVVKENVHSGSKKTTLWQKFLSNQLLFYVVIMVSQFIFYWLPGYIIPVLGAFSWICMIKPSNYILTQITDYRGLSLGSFTFDWFILNYIFGSPLVVPRWALINIAVGFILVAWVITPIIFFRNVWGTRSNPIAASTQSTENWSAMGIVTTFTAFASLSAVFVHMLLHHRRDLWKQFRDRSLNKKGNDVHCHLMSLYPDVPDWWFVIVSLLAIVIIMAVAHMSQMLVWYNVLFALSVPIVFVLPFGMVTSITGQLTQNQGVYYLMVIIASSLWVGDQSTMMSFIAIGYTTYCQTLDLVSNMKLGHYMKIAPRILFLVQALTCLVCSSLSISVQYYFYGVQRYYEQKGALEYRSEFDLTNVGATIANNTMFFDSSTPQNRRFLWALLIGAILPVPFWLASQRYKWCRLVHFPLMLAAVSWMPLVDTGTFLTWLVIGLCTTMFFNKECWKRHIYLTSSALDAGLYLCLFIIGGPLVYYNINFPTWWGTGGPTGSGCPLSVPNAALQQSLDPQVMNTYETNSSPLNFVIENLTTTRPRK